MTEPLRIDIISDVMCPWCIIGYRQLASALEASGTAHEIHWHPFELNPNMPSEGQDGFEHIAEKYGATRAQSLENRAQMTALGADLGFAFGWTDGFRMHNTFNAHQLLHWADTFGRQHDLKMAMFIAHFTNSRDLSDNAVLAEIASEIGLDRDEALAALSEQRYASEVREAETFWQQQGISSVPAVVFKGKHLVAGAQGIENYTNILSQIADMKE